MAGAATDLRDAQAPLVTLRRIFGRHIETVRVVAVVADRIGFGWVVRVGAGVVRLAVGSNVLRHNAQAGPLGLFTACHGLLPKLFMAACAIHFFQGQRRVFGMDVALFGIVRNVGMAGHALHVGVHALAEFVRHDAEQGAGFAICARNFKLGFLAIMTSQTGGVVQCCLGADGKVDQSSGKTNQDRRKGGTR
ncbi:hypothetical protein GALL_432680 [mine drainage metagenome]|uniref:Uncharacterized protein n=1 Tax=mine drainage metagenome TaxID=410659 RepID=A0A1J5Q5A3_9ZZZZ